MAGTKGDHSGWESYYRSQPVESMPWYHPGLDPDFAQEIETIGLTGGAVLDLCTGPGTQAIAVAEKGFSVTATDIADTAVRQACEQARARGLDITFRQNDILDSKLDATFDLVIDRGCYHVFPEQYRRDYPQTVAQLLNLGGYLLLKCFSDLEPNREGPFHISPTEIEDNFQSLFEIVSIRRSLFEGPVGRPRNKPPQALVCVLRRN